MKEKKVYTVDLDNCNDFTTLENAIEYMNTSDIIAPKIKLVSNVSCSGTPLTIDVEGLEIDGAGRKIFLSNDTPLFIINANNVKLENISVELNIKDTALNLVKVENTVSNTKIYNCNIANYI